MVYAYVTTEYLFSWTVFFISEVDIQSVHAKKMLNIDLKSIYTLQMSNRNIFKVNVTMARYF